MVSPGNPNSALRTVYYFLRLGRPLFLACGFTLHGLGVVMAIYNGAELNVEVLLWGQLVITAVQLLTHYSNDYYDLAADRANRTPTRWSGGSRILVEGHIKPRVALVTALAAGTVALFAALWLAFALQTGPLTLFLLLLALLLAWSYSSPPLNLNGRGLGELTGGLLITGLTPIVGYYLQAGRLDLLPFLAVLPLCLLQICMLLVINFPDAEGDMAAGKHTLLAHLGTRRTVTLYLLLLLAVYASLPLLILAGLPGLVALFLLAVSPIALWLGWRMRRGDWADPSRWNLLGFWSVGLLMASVGVTFFAFLLLVVL